MRVLIVKTSSMGDVIHTLPALTDAGKSIPDVTFDWVVEENFAEIPAWHPLVKKIIPIAWRRWRKSLFSKTTQQEIRNFIKNLRAEKYDLVIDAQGLVKSALFSRLARGLHVGLDWPSARESFASLFYQRKLTVVFEQHAVTRARQLFSKALGYDLPATVADYGIDRNRFKSENSVGPYLVFLHGTTWDTKHWPEASWVELAKIADLAGVAVKLPWGNKNELARAERIAIASSRAEVLPRLDLKSIAGVLAGAQAIVAVDTGLGHLAAALDVPTISLYGPTDPAMTGALGKSQVHLSAQFTCSPCFSKDCTYRMSSLKGSSPLYPPCFDSLGPAVVWASLKTLL